MNRYTPNDNQDFSSFFGGATFPLTKLNLSPYFCSAFLQKGSCELFIPPPCRLFLPSTDKLIKCFSACSIGVAKTHTVSLNTLELYPVSGQGHDDDLNGKRYQTAILTQLCVTDIPMTMYRENL